MTPIKIYEDGNFLLRCMSMMAYGNQNSFDEMRIRVVLKLAANKDQYLDQTILHLGHPRRHNVAIQLAMYS